MRKIFFILFGILFNYLTYSQTKKEVSITTGIIVEKDIDIPLAGAKAVLYENGVEIATTYTKSDGIITFNLKPNSDYIIEISKENYVSKRAQIITKIPPYENQQFEIAFSILLFQPCEGLDYSLLKNPVLKVQYSDVKRDFLADKIHDEIMRSKLEQLMKKNTLCLDEKFHKILTKADRLFKEKKYNEARPVYIEANELQPNNKYIKQQIALIDELLKKEKNNESSYNNLIAQADKHFENKNYAIAKETYEKALVIKPNDNYSNSQIAKINEILAKQKKELEDKKQQDRLFQQYIAEGDEAYNDICGKAINAYKKALEIKPNDPTVLKKLMEAETECNKIKAQQQLQQKYNLFITKGDSLYNIKLYDKAKEAYEQALNILPKEKYPQNRINEINSEIQKQAKATDTQYKNLIKQGDKAFDNEDYSTAKSAYQQALTIKPNDLYAKQRIEDINKILSEIQRMEAEKKANQQKYNSLITQADNAFKQAQYNNAANLYQQALKLIPQEQYPKQKLKEIDQILQEQAEQNEKKYQNLISSGDKNVAAKNYNQAINDYQNALQIKPNESYPLQQIDMINKILAEIRKQEAEKKAKFDAYNAAIIRADQFFKTQQYDQALTTYKEASSYLPDEKYPHQKIEEINQIKKQQEIQANYKKAITEADAAFNKKQYQQAKLFYTQALTIIPNDSYARDQLQKTEKAIEAEQKMLADQKARQDAYNNAISEADKNFNLKNYEIAKTYYQSALNIIPNQNYPIQRITEIDRILKDLEKRANYDNYIKEADLFFNAQQYEQAKVRYQEALKIISTENYPKQKLKEIETLLAQQAALLKQKQENEKKYRSIVAKADELFNQAKYDDALIEYENALKILPDENYPKQRISKIKDIKKLLAQQPKKTPSEVKKPQKETILPDLKFKSNAEREKYLKELTLKYPAGITCEIYQEKFRRITRYIVIRENEANDYRKIEYNWGVEYFRNDKPVTALYFDSQVKPREGEYFVTVEM